MTTTPGTAQTPPAVDPDVAGHRRALLHQMLRIRRFEERQGGSLLTMARAATA